MRRITDNQPARPVQDEAAFKVLARFHGAFAIVVSWESGEPVAKVVAVDDDTAGYVVTPIVPVAVDAAD